MRLDRVGLKRNAKDIMRSHSPGVYLVALLLLAIFYVLEYLSTRLAVPGLTQDVVRQLQRGVVTERVIRQITETQPSFFSDLLNIAIWALTILLTVGFSAFCLNISRGLEAGPGTLFDGFGNFLRLLWLNVLIGIFVFLWSLLFVIPGIIMSYAYAMTPYIMNDRPDLDASDCIHESRVMMKGYKWKLFCLDLSFIGWALLCILTLGIGFLLLAPYVDASKAAFYESLLKEEKEKMAQEPAAAASDFDFNVADDPQAPADTKDVDFEESDSDE